MAVAITDLETLGGAWGEITRPKEFFQALTLLGILAAHRQIDVKAARAAIHHFMYLAVQANVPPSLERRQTKALWSAPWRVPR